MAPPPLASCCTPTCTELIDLSITYDELPLVWDQSLGGLPQPQILSLFGFLSIRAGPRPAIHHGRRCDQSRRRLSPVHFLAPGGGCVRT